MKYAFAIIAALWTAPALAKDCADYEGLPPPEVAKKKPGVLMVDEATGEAYVVFCNGNVYRWAGKPFGKALVLEMIKRGMVVPASKGTKGKSL